MDAVNQADDERRRRRNSLLIAALLAAIALGVALLTIYRLSQGDIAR